MGDLEFDYCSIACCRPKSMFAMRPTNYKHTSQRDGKNTQIPNKSVSMWFIASNEIASVFCVKANKWQGGTINTT